MKKILLTSMAALFAVGITTDAFAVGGTGGTTVVAGDGEVSSAVLTAGTNIVASKSYVDKQTGDLTMLTVPSDYRGTLTEAINYIESAILTAGQDINIDSDNKINVVLSDNAGAYISIDSDNEIAVSDITNAGSDIVASDTGLTTGKAVFEYVSNNIQLHESDGILIDSDNNISAVGDAGRAVTVTSDGIGVVGGNGISVSSDVKAVGDSDRAVTVTANGIGVVGDSDRAVTVTSDGVGVVVDSDSIKINSDGELYADMSAVIEAGQNVELTDNNSDGITEINARSTTTCSAALLAAGFADSDANGVEDTGAAHCTVSLKANGDFYAEVVIH